MSILFFFLAKPHLHNVTRRQSNHKPQNVFFCRKSPIHWSASRSISFHGEVWRWERRAGGPGLCFWEISWIPKGYLWWRWKCEKGRWKPHPNGQQHTSRYFLFLMVLSKFNEPVLCFRKYLIFLTFSDPGFLADIENWKKDLAQYSSQYVGQTLVYLNGTFEECRFRECNLGNLICDAMVITTVNIIILNVFTQSVIIVYTESSSCFRCCSVYLPLRQNTWISTSYWI